MVDNIGLTILRMCMKSPREKQIYRKPDRLQVQLSLVLRFTIPLFILNSFTIIGHVASYKNT